MKRLLIVIALQLAAAGLGLTAVVLFFLGNLLQPTRDATQIAFYVAVTAILLLTVAAVTLAIRERAGTSYTPALAVMMVLTVLAGFLPAVVENQMRERDFAARRAEDREIDGDLMNRLGARQRDVAARIADHRAFTPQEALDLVVFVDGADLRYRGLADHSPEAFALLAQALDARLIDVNGEVEPDRRRKPGAMPLFLYYYGIRVFNGEARPNEWKMLDMLVAHGADLTRPEAKPLIDDLARRR